MYLGNRKSAENMYFFTYEPLGVRNAFHVKHISPILRLGSMESFYNATVYNYSKQAVISNSVYFKAAYNIVRRFMQQMLCYSYIEHFADV